MGGMGIDLGSMGIDLGSMGMGGGFGSSGFAGQAGPGKGLYEGDPHVAALGRGSLPPTDAWVGCCSQPPPTATHAHDEAQSGTL